MRTQHLQVFLQKFYASIAFAAVGYPFWREIRKQKIKGHGTGISYCEVDALARILFPQIQVFFESEEGLTHKAGTSETMLPPWMPLYYLILFLNIF